VNGAIELLDPEGATKHSGFMRRASPPQATPPAWKVRSFSLRGQRAVRPDPRPD
jgi:hypothetical protein